MKKRLTSLFLAVVFVFTLITDIQAITVNKTPQNMSNFIVFVRFKGDTSDELNKKSSVYPQKVFKGIYNFYTNSAPMHAGVDASFQKYIDEISFGQLQMKQYFGQDMSKEEIESFELSFTKDDVYSDYSITEEVIKGINDGRIIFDQSWKLDYKDSMVIDNLSIIVQTSESIPRSNKVLWPHKGYHSGGTNVKNQYVVGNYNMFNSYHILNSVNNFASSQQAVLVHEFVHSLGLLDLYNLNHNRNDVGMYDIMAETMRYPAYMLSYMRKEMGWIDIDHIDKSGTYTLDMVNKKEGNQAFIIETPLSNSEFFVVEYRTNLNEKGTDNLNYGFERLYSEGLLVYRVNKNSELPSNLLEQPYIYVFRPGESGFNSGDGSLKDALIGDGSNPESKSQRTSIGNQDFNETSNSIYYANGQNSGLVINNIKIKNSQLTFDLDMPDYTHLDIWKTEGNGLSANEGASDISYLQYNNQLLMQYSTYNYIGSSTNYFIETRYLKDGIWTDLSTNNPSGSAGKFVVCGAQLYLVYKEDYQTLNVDILENNQWKTISSLTGKNIDYQFGVTSLDDKIYISFSSGLKENQKQYLYRVNNTQFELLNETPTSLATNVSLTTYQGNIMTLRRINEDAVLSVLEGKDWKNLHISTITASNTYKMTTDGRNLYFIVGNNDSQEFGYLEGNAASSVKTMALLPGQRANGYEMVVVDNSIYISVFQGNPSIGKIYKFANGSFTLFGGNIGNNVKDISIMNFQDRLCVGTISEKNITTYSKQLPPQKKSENNYLKSLVATGYQINFQEDVYEYKIEVDSHIQNIEIKAEPQDMKSTVNISNPLVLNTGNNLATISVTSEVGKTREYKITIIKKVSPIIKSDNNYLSSLTVEGVPFPFSKNVSNYTIHVQNNISSVKVNAVKEHPNANVQVINPSPLIVGNNTINVKVTSESGLIRNYNLIIIRDAPVLTKATLEQELKNNGLRVDTSYIKGFNASINMSQIINNITNKGYVIKVQDVKGNNKDLNAIMRTKDKLVCTINGSTYSYTVIINGDVNGDGKISSIDYLMIKDRIMGKLVMDVIQVEAANVNRDSKVSSIDYLIIKDSIMGKITIQQ